MYKRTENANGTIPVARCSTNANFVEVESFLGIGPENSPRFILSRRTILKLLEKAERGGEYIDLHLRRSVNWEMIWKYANTRCIYSYIFAMNNSAESNLDDVII